ncbi:TerC/Alx family metal homeostasis membrane protein [Aeromicrobium duanguangcaii]|uniref:TerC/Alx family metal homeostasis membrane protein n=1 Tax=Aeromicrobium duanguangcaii TaxID=2968086 RepID=A0ABY5KG26_9ACTN|nr:TerC/Alx family metal homeostasis membrane protein [Aeromicrobium duanguangcaii]MCD9153663.1 TerC/Alx family metal homeostasis membrane protein [Aeromicrobium duanguangcaii]UUI69254.1 TerC/Alx family metal homeostasis membrane protein [Aeromicrobium duanguangcaii]
MSEIGLTTWVVTVGLIMVLLAVDLTLAWVKPHHVGFREAAAWSVFYIALALAFGVWFTWAYGGERGTEYFAGYLVEKSLSVDNLFVFVVIMATFAVPDHHQHKVLTFGIVLALVMRAIFIALGAALISAFSFMFLLFGLLLIYTAVQMHRHRGQDPDVENNAVVKAARRLLPVTDTFVDGKILTRSNGRLMVTPMLIVLLAIGSVDLLFALDSIPAVFGVTQEPYIVFVANAFALLGLRALFFLVRGLLDRLVYLSAGLAIVLAFIGLKLILHWAHEDISTAVPEIPTMLSLGVIAVVLVTVTVASLRKTRQGQAQEESASAP